MCGQVDLAKGAFANEAPECVVADRLQVLVGELIEQFLVRICELERVVSARVLLFWVRASLLWPFVRAPPSFPLPPASLRANVVTNLQYPLRQGSTVDCLNVVVCYLNSVAVGNVGFEFEKGRIVEGQRLCVRDVSLTSLMAVGRDQAMGVIKQRIKSE